MGRHLHNGRVTSEATTFYDEIGGYDTIHRIVEVFYQGVAGDNLIHLGFRDKAGAVAGLAIITLHAQHLPATKPSR